MAYENLCMYCFKDMGGASVCPHCGKDSRAAVPQIQMLPGALVHNGRFLLGRALGQDASGIVYGALDTRKGGVIRIREYLPRNCAERLNDGGVVPIAGMEDVFDAGMRKLRASVESVEDPKKRHFYFEENGTAYIAQRKNITGAPMPDEDDAYFDGEGRGRSMALYIAIAAAVVVVVAIAIIWFLSSMSDPDDVTTTLPLPTVSAEATWSPEETPTPTPYATATFAALVDPELSWMDYTYGGNVDQEYQDKQDSVQNTRKPTIIQEEDYSTVNSSSSTKSVRELQDRLVKLGWLSYADATGKYDSATKQAVKDFQRYVNDYCSPAEKLSVDGIAGKKTQQWLYNSSVSLAKPTPTPTPLVTPAPDANVIDASSSAAEIRSVQYQLINLGLMKKGSADGKYGSATKSAVRNFQIHVNKILGYNALEVTGKVDELTQAYLDYYEEDWLLRQEEAEKTTPKPTATATPTPKPTEEPETGVVNKGSSKKKIAAVQELLGAVGLLDEWDVDGVYGSGTVAAVKKFQKWVNEVRGEETLKITGECDLLTQQYLRYCAEKGMIAADPTEAPTPRPTEEPDEGKVVVDEGSPKESISFVQEMLMTVGLLDESDVDGSYGERTVKAVKAFQSFVNDYYGVQKVYVTGVCDETTLQYLEYAYSNEWNIGDVNEDEPEPTPIPAPTDEPDESTITVNASSSKKQVKAVQQLLSDVGLLDESDVDGSFGRKTRGAIEELQRFVNEQKGEQVLEISGECDPLTRRYLEYFVEEGWNLGEMLDPSEDTPAPTEPPVEADPTNEPAKPSMGEVKGFSVEVDGSDGADQLIELESGKHVISWSADSGVEGYYVYLYDGSGSLINSKTTSRAGEISIKASSLKFGEIYTLRIGALPKGGGEDDIIWQTVQLTRYVSAEEEATPEPTQPPRKPSVGAPAIHIGSSAYQQDGVTYISGETVIFSWMADGDVQYYNAELLYEDGTSYSLGDTSDTSRTVSISQLNPGMWKLRVGAMPIDGGRDDMVWSELIFGVPASKVEEEIPSQPAETPDEPSGDDPVLTYVDAFSSEDDIRKVQIALYKFGLINSDEVKAGVLDEITIEAVIRFQQRVNEVYGIELEVIDPNTWDNIFIDERTLDCLLYRDMDLNS